MGPEYGLTFLGLKTFMRKLIMHVEAEAGKRFLEEEAVSSATY